MDDFIFRECRRFFQVIKICPAMVRLYSREVVEYPAACCGSDSSFSLRYPVSLLRGSLFSQYTRASIYFPSLVLKFLIDPFRAFGRKPPIKEFCGLAGVKSRTVWCSPVYYVGR